MSPATVRVSNETTGMQALKVTEALEIECQGQEGSSWKVERK